MENQNIPEPEHDDEGFEILKRKVLRDRGLDTSQYKNKFLIRRFHARMRYHRITTYEQYEKLLNTDSQEYNRLIDKITINVTEFFRNPEMWASFKENVLPRVLENPKQKRIVRFWSAGCATGEEVYTIALVVDQYLWNKDSNLQIVIRGTDLDPIALQKARRGLYHEDKLRKMPQLYKKLYFTRKGNEYQMNKKIIRSVRLAKHDLISGRKQKYFDVIFCRNVIIYFTKAQQNALFRSFHKTLSIDGYLILGKTETLMGNVKTFYKVIDTHERIFQKV